MSERNEDKFGIIEDKTHQFNSLEEAGNYTKDLKEKLKRKASMEEFPISTSMPEDRIKFIDYSISLMTKRNLPFYDAQKIGCAKSVLGLISRGYTYESIATYLKRSGFSGATVQKVKDAEKEGLVMARKAIERVKNNSVPVLGG